MDSDVIIVAHNSGRLLVEAVSSAVDQVGAGHIWVMDTQSDDGSIDDMLAVEPGVNVTTMPNKGFAAANNKLIEQTQSPYVMLLNPDACLKPGAVRTLEEAAASSPRAGIVGALLLNADGSVQRNSSGRFPSLGEALRLKLLRAARWLLGPLAPSAKTPASTTQVDWVSGAAMLVKREAIVDAGPMDEGFFLYREDIEWCHRMRDHGWDVLLEPRALVVHHRGKSVASSAAAAKAYRDSFYHYCDIYGLWGLKLAARCGVFFRRRLGGRP